MILNLVRPKLKRGFPRFNQPIRNGNWTVAAEESHRQDISAPRNRHVQKLLSGKLHQQDNTQVATWLLTGRTFIPELKYDIRVTLFRKLDNA